ncbi:MAG: hypothetical protein HQL13_04615 [Candidatus Omnitrophica bacterium]|nr:hypothetical protein [Candidatus Omnitrophota bacterium]
MYIKNKKGQSTVEYVLLATAVIAVIIAFVSNPSSPFRNQMVSTLNQTVNQIGEVSGRIQESQVTKMGNFDGTPQGYAVTVTTGNGQS